jgi:hypothetical protein
MNIKLQLLFIVFSIISCSKDPIICPNAIPGEIKINNRQYTLVESNLAIGSTSTGLSPHEIIFKSVREDCTTSDRFRFYLTVNSGQKLEGSFSGEDTKVYKDRKITSFVHDGGSKAFTLENSSTENFIQLENLTGAVLFIAENEYEILLKAKEVKSKKDYKVSLKHRFN